MYLFFPTNYLVKSQKTIEDRGQIKGNSGFKWMGFQLNIKMKFSINRAAHSERVALWDLGFLVTGCVSA